MKKNQIFAIATFIMLIVAVSCNNERVNREVVNSSDNASTNARFSDETINYEDEGVFLYKTLKFHSSHFDPYSLIPEQDRALYKSKIDSVKLLKITNPNLIWDEGVSKKNITLKTSEKLKKTYENALAFMNETMSSEPVDKWFMNEITQIKQDKGLLFEEKDFIIHHSTIMRYAVKAYLETNNHGKTSKAARTSTSCGVQILNCFFGNVATYSGIGSFFNSSSTSTTSGTTAGTTVGAIAGALISFASCSCGETVCDYPKFLSTPDVCYSPFSGLNFVTGGFGSATNHFTWHFTDSNGTAFFTRDSRTNTTRLDDSELGGRTYFEVYVTAFCNGGDYKTSRVGININNLGKPSFFLSGSTSPQVNSQQFYSISGRNLNNVNWGAGSIGQILSQNPYGINVRWNSTGYAYLYANAQSDCGSFNSGLNVIVNN